MHLADDTLVGGMPASGCKRPVNRYRPQPQLARRNTSTLIRPQRLPLQRK